MIFKSVEISPNDHQLTHKKAFYACGYEPGSKLIILMSPDEKTPIQAGSKLRSKLNGFGATTWAELQDEIAKRKLIK